MRNIVVTSARGPINGLEINGKELQGKEEEKQGVGRKGTM